MEFKLSKSSDPDYQKTYYAKNRERIKQRTGQYRKDHMELYRKAGREWYWRNPEKARVQALERKWKNIEVVRARARQNRSKVKSIADTQKRRALKKSSRVNLKSITAWMKLIKSKGLVSCYYCQKKIPTDLVHFDHIVPLSKGGPHCVENLCTACPKCNQHKSNKPVRVWIQSGQQLLEV